MESQQDRYRRWRLLLNRGGMTTSLFSSIEPEVRPEDREHLNSVAREKGLPSFNDIIRLDFKLKYHKNILERLLTAALPSASTGVGAPAPAPAPAPKPTLTLRLTQPRPEPEEEDDGAGPAPAPAPAPVSKKRKREEKPAMPKPKRVKFRDLMAIVDAMDEEEEEDEVAYGGLPAFALDGLGDDEYLDDGAGSDEPMDLLAPLQPSEVAPGDVDVGDYLLDEAFLDTLGAPDFYPEPRGVGAPGVEAPTPPPAARRSPPRLAPAPRAPARRLGAPIQFIGMEAPGARRTPPPAGPPRQPSPQSPSPPPRRGMGNVFRRAARVAPERGPAGALDDAGRRRAAETRSRRESDAPRRVAREELERRVYSMLKGNTPRSARDDLRRMIAGTSDDVLKEFLPFRGRG